MYRVKSFSEMSAESLFGVSMCFSGLFYLVMMVVAAVTDNLMFLAAGLLVVVAVLFLWVVGAVIVSAFLEKVNKEASHAIAPDVEASARSVFTNEEALNAAVYAAYCSLREQAPEAILLSSQESIRVRGNSGSTLIVARKVVMDALAAYAARDNVL